MPQHVWQEPQQAPGNRSPVSENVAGNSLPTHRWRLSPLALLGIACAAVAAVVLVLLVTERGDKQIAVPAPDSGPALVSQAQLERLAASSGHPVYWAGPKSGFSYELTRLADGRIYVRYLPHGVSAGDPRPDFLVVGTYPRAGSYATLKRAGHSPGSLALPVGDRGIAVFSTKQPTSVYLGYRNAPYQVEVYSPLADTARRLALSGSVTPIR
jgi:hypothetical protein